MGDTGADDGGEGKLLKGEDAVPCWVSKTGTGSLR
jgi:hypothetical protein